MSDLRSAALPDLQPDDHVRGVQTAQLLIEYVDLQCPYCAVLHVKLLPLVQDGSVRLVIRHFPLRSAHPRSWAAASALEAAGLQGRFWEMHDLLLADQGRIDDPHLWQRAEQLGLDLDRFEEDRRSEAVRERVKRDFNSGVRAGVVTTPTLFSDGVSHYEAAAEELLARISRSM